MTDRRDGLFCAGWHPRDVYPAFFIRHAHIYIMYRYVVRSVCSARSNKLRPAVYRNAGWRKYIQRRNRHISTTRDYGREEEGMYQKEIIYMGLYKNGTRIGSAGFVKVESREENSRLYLKTQNIPHNINGRFPIRVYNGSDWKEINGITIQDGVGIWEEELAGRANHAMLQVMLPGGYLLEGRSKSAAEARQNTEAQHESDMQGQAETYRETTIPEEAQEHSENVMPMDTQAAEKTDVQKDMDDTMSAEAQQHTAKTPVVIMTEEVPRRPMREASPTPENAAVYPLKEDKWEQILDTYEQIHPYGDERVYVKLEPKDFVILQSNYQHLVNNSFLLHGFYNYRYLILGKEQDYYLGVPGVFYEREKMVALMFGFEAFECPGGNVRAGEFGYYLRKVEL